MTSNQDSSHHPGYGRFNIIQRPKFGRSQMMAILRAWKGHKWGSQKDDPNVPSATWRRRMWPSPDSNFSSPEQVMTTCLPQSYSDDKVGELSCIQVTQGVPTIGAEATLYQSRRKLGKTPDESPLLKSDLLNPNSAWTNYRAGTQLWHLPSSHTGAT